VVTRSLSTNGRNRVSGLARRHSGVAGENAVNPARKCRPTVIVLRLRWKREGAHYHCRLFTSFALQGYIC
jgi:hypothetical protein